ncbi:MAG: hypothetical protein AB1505_24200 [Candidatus Latescibacterota bacterium]
MGTPGTRQLVDVAVDAGQIAGPLEAWRQGLGHGGINALPLPDRVVRGVAALRPRLVRIFIQEFLRVYPEHGRFDWTRLDPYMAALEATGAQVMAALCIKPPPLYPRVDHRLWRPADVGEWQQVVAALVRRYSVERRLVTHWEVGNEVDIGESGGSPYLITDGREYGEYYALTTQAVLGACPQARVGGPAAAHVHSPVVAGFLEHCAQRGTRVDFLSYHLYHSDPALHLEHLRAARALVERVGLPAVELMVTEWNRRLFDGISVADDAADPRRAAAVAATVMRLVEAGLHGSFYYHVWDQTCYAADFRPFFSDEGLANMLRHWNEVPHRLGLFGVGGEVRPQYFVYWMLSRLGSERLAAHSGHGDLTVLAARQGGTVSIMLANYGLERPADRVAVLQLSGLQPGVRRLAVWRLDAARRWDEEARTPDGAPRAAAAGQPVALAGPPVLRPVEQREVDTADSFSCQVLLPADAVALVRLEPVR